MSSKTGALQSSLGPLKYHVGKKIKYAMALVDEATPDDVEEITSLVDRLELSHANLDSSLNKYMSKYEEWTAKVDEIDDPDVQEKEQGLFDAKIQEHADLVDSADEVANRINLRVRKLHDHQTRTAAAVAANTPNVGADRKSHPVKPPKLSVPTFQGEYLEWEQFWSMFDANIHQREDVTNIEKFTCLLCHVDGPAKQVLRGIVVTNDSYLVAIDLLKDLFDRATTRIVPMLYAKLQKMPPCDKKIANKMQTFDECERIFRQLELAGEEVKQTQSYTGTLLSKFPAGMIHDLQLHHDVDANSQLEDAREAVKKLLKRQETTFALLEDVQTIRSLSSGETSKGQNKYKDPDTTVESPKQSGDSTFAAVTSGPNRKPNWKPSPKGAQMLTPSSSCYFCGGNHFNGSCTVFPTASSRYQRLLQLNRCGRCTRAHQGHCRTQIKCVHCRTDHNHTSALCQRQFPDQVSPNSATTSQLASQPPAMSGGAVPITAAPMSSAFPSTSTLTFQPASPTAGGVHFQPSIPVPSAATLQSSNPVSQSPLPPAPAVTGLTGLTMNQPKRRAALFQTAKTTVFNPVTGHCSIMRLVMDTLSSRTYIRESAARSIGLLGKKSDNIYVSVFGTNKQVPVATQKVGFDIMLGNGMKLELFANTTKVICASRVLPKGWTDLERSILEANQHILADDSFDEDASVDILIGADYVWEFMLGEKVPTHSPTMFFIPTALGFMIAGTSEFQDNDASLLTMLCITEVTSNFPAELGLAATVEPVFEKSQPDINEYWDLERIGITDDPIVNDDDVAFDKFQQTVTFDEGRYQAQLPWIDEKRAILPTNYDVAYDRFRSLSKRLRKSPELLQGYRDILKLQDERGIIEKVPPEQIETENVVHYLPHHPVIRSSSATTKIRIVFDASAKRNREQLSLNECLLRGPVILPDLCQLLMRFRTCEIVVISDIEKAFLQVALQHCDRDVTRFLWFKDDQNLDLQDNIEMRRYCRVNFGVISSPFLLAATIDHHLSHENTTFAESLRKDIYVDNVISGLSGDDDPVEYYHDLKALFNRAGMNIQEFCSNSKRLMASIPEKDRVRSSDVKVLGLKWDSTTDDTLRLVPSSKIRDAVNTETVTKRLVLQALASIFDPLGWYQPVLFPAKMLLQRLWSLKLGWDDPINDELRAEWETLRASFTKLFDHRLSRCVGRASDGSNTLVVLFYSILYLFAYMQELQHSQKRIH